VESISELNKICQKRNYRTEGSWFDRYIARDLAIRVSWALLHTPITANQVTLLGLLIGLAGCFAIGLSGPILYLTGSLLLQIWYVLDKADGQIARYRKTMGLTGLFFDFIVHHIMHSVIFFALGLYAHQVTGKLLFVVWGFFTGMAIGIFNRIDETKYATFFVKFDLIRNITPKSPDSPKLRKREVGMKSVLKNIFSFLHKMSEIHILNGVLLITALFQTFRDPSFDFRLWLFSFYGIVVPAISVTKIAYIILRNEIENEFNSAYGYEEKHS